MTRGLTTTNSLNSLLIVKLLLSVNIEGAVRYIRGGLLSLGFICMRGIWSSSSTFLITIHDSY